MRQYLDGLFLANNGRYAIDSNKVNLDDMLTSRPGGLVRTNGDPAGTIMPLVHPNTGSFAIEGLNYLDSQKEVRTGITKNAQGHERLTSFIRRWADWQRLRRKRICARN